MIQVFGLSNLLSPFQGKSFIGKMLQLFDYQWYLWPGSELVNIV